MLERLIKNKDEYNIIELNQATFEIIEFLNTFDILKDCYDYKNLLSEQALEDIKNKINYTN